MDIGVVGLAGSGRSTVFQALLAQRARGETGERHASGAIGTIYVPDPRLDRLCELFQPKKKTPIEIRIHDLCPSLEPSFPTGEIEGMKRMEVLLLVIPAFADPAPEAWVTALDRLMGELCLEDLAAIERRLKRAVREKIRDQEKEALEIAQMTLEKEHPIYAAELDEEQRNALRGYAFVTDRPMIAVLNVAEEQAGKPVPAGLTARADEYRLAILSLSAALEAEMSDLPAEEQADFLAEYGVTEPAGGALTRALLERCDIIPFFTVGEDECRAWAIERGIAAKAAAGKIHSDIERGFIRAEVIGYDEFHTLDGGLAEAKKLGKLRLEGKEYVVQDGDIVHYRFNV